MKQMVFSGMLASLILLVNLSADKALLPATTEPVTASHGYVNFGLGPVPIPWPCIGIGGRFQKGHRGLDVSAQFSTVVLITVLKENVLYLHFPKPNLAYQYYVGGGLGITEVLSILGFDVTISPQAIIGKEYVNESGDRRFFQAQLDWPLIRVNNSRVNHSKSNKITFLPIIVVSYGICF